MKRLTERIRPLWVAARERVAGLVFERSAGTRTGDRVNLEDFGLAHRDRISYTPSHWLRVRRALRRCGVGPEDVLIDYGSGKGRVLLVAARHPMKRVIGIEISPQLNRIASENLDRARATLACAKIELVTADATEYEPPDDVTIVYMYNPFRGEVFRRALERLLESADRNPRRVRLAYMNPTEHATVMATRRFRLVKTMRALRPTRAWSRSGSVYLYELLPSEGAAANLAPGRRAERPRAA